MIYTFHISRCR